MNATTSHLFVLGSLTSQLTTWIGNHGAYAVFAIMAVDALLPVGGELMMLSRARSPRARSPARSRSLGDACRPGPRASRPLARRDARLPHRRAPSAGRSAAAAGGRSSSGTAVAAHHTRDARPCRALVRPPRARRRLPRPPHAAGPIVHLGPGRRAREPARAVHGPHARRVGDLVLRVRGRGVGARLQLREGPPRLPLRRHRRRRVVVVVAAVVLLVRWRRSTGGGSRRRESSRSPSRP